MLASGAACVGRISGPDRADGLGSSGPGSGGAAGSATAGASAGGPVIEQPPPFNPPLPFEALDVSAGAAKVKKVMTGAPLTEEERASVVADPDALPALVDRWMELPQWRERLLFFFQQVFQQTQLRPTSIVTTIKFITASKSSGRTATR